MTMHCIPYTLDAAAAHFEAADPTMAALLTQVRSTGALTTLPTAQPSAAFFDRISRAIIGQQISTKAAASIYHKTVQQLGTITPEQILATDIDTLRQCGLSPQKITYLTYNATHWHTLPIESLHSYSDAEVLTTLTSLHGIGTWTAEMFLIFTLARPDVFSYGDLGLLQSLYHYYQYHPHYTKKIATTVDRWSPYKSVASLTLWAARDTGVALP